MGPRDLSHGVSSDFESLPTEAPGPCLDVDVLTNRTPHERATIGLSSSQPGGER